MTESFDLDLQSKALKDGNMIRLMDFAVRGLPRNFIKTEQRVDLEWAKAVFKPEILLIDELRIDPRWFWSGTIGAALISLVIWPQTLELWRRLAERRVYRDERGVDAPGLLFELVERHQNDERLTRRPEFQMYVFQSALAVAQAWVHHDRVEQRYHQVPPVPDVPELTARVRKRKGMRHAMTGFRPPSKLRPRWFKVDPPELVHAAGMSDVMSLVDEAIELETDPPAQSRIEDAAKWIRSQDIPGELFHPAAMAAAVVTLAADDRCRSIWSRVLAGTGRRCPEPPRKPAADTAMVIQDCIKIANRGREPLKDALYLYFRIKEIVRLEAKNPNRLWRRLPTVLRSEVESSDLWAGSNVTFASTVRFGSERPALELISDPDNSDHEEEGAVNGNSTRRSPETYAKRIGTGEAAEEWFEANFRQVIPGCDDAILEDCRKSGKGFDYRCKKTSNDEYVEVKGLLAAGGSIALTDGEWDRAKLEGDKYHLVVVVGIDTDEPRPIHIPCPAAVLKPKKRERKNVVMTWEIDFATLERILNRSLD